MKRSQIKRRNSKRDWWTPLRNKLKFAFVRADILRCEIRHTGCLGGMFLGFCHSLRRRFCTTPELQQEVILGCVSCHRWLDAKPHEETARLVRYIIVMRETKVELV